MPLRRSVLVTRLVELLIALSALMATQPDQALRQASLVEVAQLRVHSLTVLPSTDEAIAAWAEALPTSVRDLVFRKAQDLHLRLQRCSGLH